MHRRGAAPRLQRPLPRHPLLVVLGLPLAAPARALPTRRLPRVPLQQMQAQGGRGRTGQREGTCRCRTRARTSCNRHCPSRASAPVRRLPRTQRVRGRAGPTSPSKGPVPRAFPGALRRGQCSSTSRCPHSMCPSGSPSGGSPAACQGLQQGRGQQRRRGLLP